MLAVFESQRSRAAMICVLLAILEMVKMQAIVLVQREAFGEIMMRRHKRFDEVFASEERLRDHRKGLPLDRMEPLDTTPPAELEDVMPDQLAAAAEAPPADEESARLRPCWKRCLRDREPLSRSSRSPSPGASHRQVEKALAELTAEFDKPEHGIMIREVAGGYKMPPSPSITRPSGPS